jgi:hypothetical protein
MIKLRMNIGKMQIEADLADMKAVHKLAGIYGSLPTECTNCKSKNIGLGHRHVGGFDYYSLHCSDCSADGNFGQAKVGGELFWKHGSKMTVYQGENNEGN